MWNYNMLIVLEMLHDHNLSRFMKHAQNIIWIYSLNDSLIPVNL